MMRFLEWAGEHPAQTFMMALLFLAFVAGMFAIAFLEAKIHVFVTDSLADRRAKRHELAMAKIQAQSTTALAVCSICKTVMDKS